MFSPEKRVFHWTKNVTLLFSREPLLNVAFAVFETFLKFAVRLHRQDHVTFFWFLISSSARSLRHMLISSELMHFTNQSLSSASSSEEIYKWETPSDLRPTFNFLDCQSKKAEQKKHVSPSVFNETRSYQFIVGARRALYCNSINDNEEKIFFPLQWISRISFFLLQNEFQWTVTQRFQLVTFDRQRRIIRRSVIVNFRYYSPISPIVSFLIFKSNHAFRLVASFFDLRVCRFRQRFFFFVTLDNVVQTRSIFRSIVSIQRRDRYIKSIREGMAAGVRAFYLAVLLSLV